MKESVSLLFGGIVKKLKGLRTIAVFLLVAVIGMTAGCAKKKTGVWSVNEGQPNESFFGKNVVYDYPVKFEECTDAAGIKWQVGYMDVTPQNANGKVLVLIHGKGANAGYFGYVMRKALAKGIRVIAPDLPHYGKSIAGNIDKPLSRSLDQTREAIYDLVVNKLGVKKAVYLGHSLGGQWVMGYALKYPDAVEKLILESPGGLEQFRIPMFSPKFINDLAALKENPIYKKMFDAEFAKTPEAIRLFYYYKMKDASGKVVKAPVGYFVNDSEYAQFLTEVRVKMITNDFNTVKGKEYYNYVITYVRDVFTLGIEMYPKSAYSIYEKYPQIKAPILVLFGKDDAFIPTMVSGMKKFGLNKGIILPFYKMMKEAGNIPTVKLYSGVGHFPHTDIPDEFSDDVISYTISNKVSGAETNIDSW